jgi:hypothetical protein
MMELIGVTSVRPGPSGTPGQPNSANTDESKANQYTTLPDPLVLNNGKPVKTAKVWVQLKCLQMKQPLWMVM